MSHAGPLPGAPIRVAVVGGGCAALSCAFELTRPELEGRYAVTVYQMGWRLGGKGASGRGPSGRIEEHGLHLWMGYYENAFRLMRECYAELQREREHPWRFEDAFSPAHFNGAMDWSPSRGWVPWKVRFPAMSGLPGDPDPPKFRVVDYLAHAAKMLRTLISTLPVEASHRESGLPLPTPQELGPSLQRLAKYGAVAGLAAAIEGLTWLELALKAVTGFRQSQVFALVDVVLELLRKELLRMSKADDEVRRLWEVAELILATIRGSIRFRLIFDPRGFDAIDEYDCREWLRLNGASQEAINSAFIRALYDLAFAFAEGDPQRPAIAAGSAIRGAFRAFFSYRGAFFWKMNAGMGDVVFAPLYQVLKKRGVRFEFFHKLTDVQLSSSRSPSAHVTALEFDVQARTRNGAEYEPLCLVKGLPCWPARPLSEQLVPQVGQGEVDLESQWDRRLAEPKTLRVGADFDLVVLGVGLGVVKSVCSSLIERSDRWRQMVEHVKSVPTQAFQLWLEKDARELGWGDEAVNLSGFVEPFDTWADLTHLAKVEDWQTEPRSIAYFCNVLPDSGGPAADDKFGSEFLRAQEERVQANSIRFLEQDAKYLWPLAHRPAHGFRWEWLASADPEQAASRGQGASLFLSQYFTANVRPSDRYSQALPGTTRYRISPLDRDFDNLTVAGDWTKCGINMGCVEAAVMSGLLAAHAICGLPKLENIVGYDHP